ncbi:MAG TPA: hypothetical protein PKD16_18045 [Saprospiraceae bacterium]|jgi:L-rhamnose mutarotase|nr:hypothetical protein [Saprospiraceae bacterium]
MVSDILGAWVVDLEDVNSLDKLGEVLLNFSKEGILRYSIFNGEKEEVILMTYRLENDIIETSQPSHPDEINRTQFKLIGDVLYLNFNGEQSRFLRLDNGYL